MAKKKAKKFGTLQLRHRDGAAVVMEVGEGATYTKVETFESDEDAKAFIQKHSAELQE